MRELKFRAWDGKRKRMGCRLMWVEFFMRGGELKARNYRRSGGVQMLEVMQYTGLKDKSRTEIYEGDVLENPWGHRGAVSFCEQMAAFCWDGGEEWGRIEPEDVRVIGNIYENPELLGQEQEQEGEQDGHM